MRLNLGNDFHHSVNPVYVLPSLQLKKFLSCSHNALNHISFNPDEPCKSNPIADLWQAHRFPGGWGSQISKQSAYEGGKFVSPTHRPPLPPGLFLVLIYVKRLSQPQGHSAAGMIMSMKNSTDTIGNRTRDLPACSTASTNIATAYPDVPWTVNITTAVHNSYLLTYFLHGAESFLRS
jgi:hypothetical protein